MKRSIFIVFLFVCLAAPTAEADMFGGDVAVLVQILANAFQQLEQLKSILDTGRDNVDLIRDINRGINDSLALAQTLGPNDGPGTYQDWRKVQDGLRALHEQYGDVVQSNDSSVQQDTDQSVAEAVALNNNIYEYSKRIDDVGELIKEQSHVVSPGGAAKLTAQSIGVLLTVQNEMLRTQATGLKLQAQALAIQNRKDKERTRQMVAGAESLDSALTNAQPDFKLPRFQ